MSLFIKAKLKTLKEALGAKDWSKVEKVAGEVLSFESSNYNARVFRSLALFNLDRFDEAEESYKKAIEDSPSQVLARQGLASFYEKRLRWGDYAWSLLELMDIFLASNEAIKYAETLQKLIEVRRSHGTTLELISVFSNLLPSSPSRPLLNTLPPVNQTSPTASTVHSIQLALLSNLPILLEILALIEAEESQIIEAEIKKRRQRLGGQTMSAIDTRKSVQSELMKSSQLVSIYQAILDDPDASEKEELRRDIEHRLLTHLRTYLESLPSSFDRPTLDLKAIPKRKEVLLEEEKEKARVRREVEELSRGLVVIRSVEESAWLINLEWSDTFSSVDRINWLELNAYSTLFSESGLGRITLATHQRIIAAAEDEEIETKTAAPLNEEMIETIEAGLASSPNSILAHILSLAFFFEEKEWDVVVQISESGLSALKRVETEIGRALPLSRRTLERNLAIALVHFEAPKNHLRALRLLESLLSSSNELDASLTIAKAYILQASEDWIGALKFWQITLAFDFLPTKIVLEVKAERAWCLFEARELENATISLEEVVQEFENRKILRDEEMKIKMKVRSKAGIELGEGVQEGETTFESEERAKSWWRLGKCYWARIDEPASEEGEQFSTKAYDTFVASIKASPHFSASFTSLGLYYLSLSPPQAPQASKCFQKAFELSGSEEVAARYLAEEFSESGDWDIVELIARRVVDGNKGQPFGGKVAERLSWAWKAIGGAELNSKRYTTAIGAFQSALRGAPNDVHTWIRLGVTYRESGKHVAALKVFARALAIDPNSWYAKFSIGDVQKETGLYEAAIETFRNILLDRPEELGVLIVLAETLLALGKDQIMERFLGRGERSLVDSLKIVEKVIGKGLATRVGWKVAGDCLSGLGGLPSLEFSAEATPIAGRLLAKLEEEKIDGKIEEMDSMTTLLLQGLFEEESTTESFTALATLAYKMRVLLETQIDESVGSAWLDLGMAISALRPLITLLALETTSEEILNQSIRCLKNGLRREPVNGIFWNALGVLSFDVSPRLSQHSFIKAIEHSPRSAVPWTNLGIFYLFHRDEDLANQAFLKAQVLDPDWTSAWVGQAILAEMAGHGEESRMLFEHAFTLAGTNLEADIGFATTSLTKFKSSITTAAPVTALSAPIFALSRYLSLRPTDFNALHLNGLLLEQVGDLSTASESLEKAVTILEELYEIDESAMVESQFIIAQTNLGRIRLASDDYEGALGAFETALSLIDLSSPETFAVEGSLSQTQALSLFIECRLGSALAHHFLDDGSEMEILETTLEDLDSIEGVTSGQRDSVELAIGRSHFVKGDFTTAMSSFEDTGIISESLVSIVRMTTVAAAIITEDTGILQASKKSSVRATEVLKFPNVVLMTVQSFLAIDDCDGAIKFLSRALHISPESSSLRLDLVELLLKAPDSISSSTLKNLEIASRIVPEDKFENSTDRARSMVANSIIKLQLKKKVVELEESDQVEGVVLEPENPVEEGIKLLERALFFNPSDRTLRTKLKNLVELYK